jgi:hypothetical protein
MEMSPIFFHMLLSYFSVIIFFYMFLSSSFFICFCRHYLFFFICSCRLFFPYDPVGSIFFI